MTHLVGHAAHEQPLQVAQSAASHHDEVGGVFLGVSRDFLHWAAVPDDQLHVLDGCLFGDLFSIRIASVDWPWNVFPYIQVQAAVVTSADS